MGATTTPSDEPPRLATARLALTPLQVADADAMVDVLGDERMHEFTGGRPLTLDELRERYRHLVVGHSADGSERWCNWIVRLGAEATPIGAMQATIVPTDALADVAWEIGTAWQGQGYAAEAATAVVTWLQECSPGTTIRALVHPDHVASARVAARAGLVATSDRVDGEVVWRRSPG